MDESEESDGKKITKLPKKGSELGSGRFGREQVGNTDTVGQARFFQRWKEGAENS